MSIVPGFSGDLRSQWQIRSLVHCLLAMSMGTLLKPQQRRTWESSGDACGLMSRMQAWAWAFLKLHVVSLHRAHAT